jgi:genome maintenance exonuclease 1
MKLKNYDRKLLPELPKLVRTIIGGTRHYVTPKGAFPSITSVLSIRNKEGIYEWRKRVGNEEANRITKRATTRGTHFHSLLEKYFLNEIDDFDAFSGAALDKNPAVWYLFLEAVQVLETKINNIYCIEDYLYSDEYKVAGAVDMIAEYDGVVSVIDFKTSNSEKKEEWIENYFIQGTAYAKMFTERTGIPCSQLVIFIVPDNGIPQIFTKSVDDYTPQLITAIEDFSNYQKKT